ncbi:asparagine synthase (glutamine-hydrolyzing) [Sorangium sp. So ce291]|uniref:asparagine synthase (glutamine-hydrolyzing) n=1 Tax=Sorangium sp. So ce291 TaxID=3133294 RepID=UPI003F5DEE77
MCGLAGIFDLRLVGQADRHDVQRMLHAMSHRGPDGTGLSAESRDAVLGTVRLAMIDSARQIDLLQNEDGTIILAYNGEVYNYRQLRRRLQARGHAFQTDSDGEVIVHLYEEELDGGIQELDGMFAFALWDVKNRRLLLARDHLGIKPLYYQQQGQRITFASELKALLAGGASIPEIDSHALMDYYHYRFVSAPRTIFKGISKLEPGSLLLATQEGVTLKRYWKPRFDGRPDSRTFKEILHSAVDSTSTSDHPLGVFLSGGLDSSSILAARSSSVDRLLSFTIGYQGAGWEDEGDEARAVARHFGSHNVYRKIHDAEIHEALRAAVWHLDEPLYSTVSVSTYALAELASRSVKGVLTGDGSDELLLGYNYLIKVRDTLEHDGDWRGVYKAQIGWLPDLWRSSLLVEPGGKTGNVFLESDHDASPLDVIREFETCYRLPEYHLTRVDRLTMAHSVEARVPFLRRDIVEWLCGWRAEDLLVPGRQKALLRDAFATALPERTITKGKQPFTAPHAGWLKNPLRESACELLLASGHHHELGVKRESLQGLLSAFYGGEEALLPVVWGIYVLFEWYQMFVKEFPKLHGSRDHVWAPR